MTPQAEHKTLNGIHVSKVVKLRLRILNVQIATSSRTDKNVEKVCQVNHEDDCVWSTVSVTKIISVSVQTQLNSIPLHRTAVST
jgi:hypothetical protein